MKKSILFIALFFAAGLKAQTPGLLLGIESGAGVAAMTGSSSRLGFSSGLFMQYDFKNMVSLRWGAYYELKGGGFSGREYDASPVAVTYNYYSGITSLHYLTFPLLARKSFGKSAFKGFVEGGPYLAHLLATNVQMTSGYAYGVGYTSYGSTEFGLQAGLGVSYTAGHMVFSLAARNGLGINGGNNYNGNLLLGVAYRFKTASERRAATADSLRKKPGRWSIGAEAGGGKTRLWGSEVLKKTHEPQNGVLAGAFVQYDLSRIFSLRSGLCFELKGSHVPHAVVPNPYFTGGASWQFNYLTVPLLARLTLGHRFKYFIHAGPYIGFLITQAEKINYDNPYVPSVTVFTTKEFKHTDFGAIAGTGVAYDFGRVVLSVEARGSAGLININELNGPQMHTGSINALLGIAYKL